MSTLYKFAAGTAAIAVAIVALFFVVLPVAATPTCQSYINSYGIEIVRCDDAVFVDGDEVADEICNRQIERGGTRRNSRGFESSRALVIECLQLRELRRIRGALERMEKDQSSGIRFDFPN